MNELEREVLRMLLAGDIAALGLLRAQLAVAEVERRMFSGAGFFTFLRLPPSTPRLDGGSRLVIAFSGQDVLPRIFLKSPVESASSLMVSDLLSTRMERDTVLAGYRVTQFGRWPETRWRKSAPEPTSVVRGSSGHSTGSRSAL